MDSLLLHICCGPCAVYPITRLKNNYSLGLLFYGPNIHPREEYDKRLAAGYMVAEREKVELIETEYDSERWLEITQPYQNEPEGGQRCSLCFQQRLERTAQVARKKGFNNFATTLTISPHKPASVINPIGEAVAREYGITFLPEDFKKRDGFKQTCRLSRQYGLYRQTYCGCKYSLVIREHSET